MNTKKALILIAVLAVIAAGSYYFYVNQGGQPPGVPGATPTPTASATPTPEKFDLIRVTSPKPNDTIKSPVTVTGEARGNWYFEASFPVRVTDANGKELGVVPAQAQGEWMTTEFVPFRAILKFSQPSTDTGFVVFQKDNPSGLPEHDDELRIPVRFDRSAASANETDVVLYYYSPKVDVDSQGNLLCSRQGLVPVARKIPNTRTPLKDTINLLLKGELSASERAEGITTEYPLAGLTLKSAVLANGVATLTFDDPQNKTGGGSCRVGVLWFQIEATARQFPSVQSVKFLPEELFQP